jgi:hypothetical protein
MREVGNDRILKWGVAFERNEDALWRNIPLLGLRGLNWKMAVHTNFGRYKAYSLAKC